MKSIIFSIVTFFFMSSGLFASYKEALSLYEAKRYKESLKMIAAELEILRDMEPDSPNYRLRFLAAHNHWKLGSVQSAVAHFRRCIDIKKENSAPLIDISFLYLDLKRYSDARAFARKSIKIKETAVADYIIGQSFLKQREYRKAKKYFEKAVSINPELSIAYNGMGITLMRLKRYTQANTAFSAAFAVGRFPEVMNNIGRSLEKSGKPDKAFFYYEKALALAPDNLMIKKNFERLKKKREKK